MGVRPASAAPSTPETPSSYVAITKVVDGDTFDVLVDGKTERVRVIGIDTPETVDPRKTVQCFGQEASESARTLLTGKRVHLDADPTQGDRDRYGRLLRYAYREDGLFFNEWMIQQGYAHEYTYVTPYQFQQAFKAAEREAREAGRGLWAEDACPVPAPGAATPPIPSSPARSLALPAGGAGVDGHTWYASSYGAAKYYYCDTDEGWRALSEKYLLSFPSEAALRERFPSYTLHEPCG